MAVIPPKEWEPSLDEKAVRDAVWNYTTNPSALDVNEDSIRDLETHASYYNVPFARSEEHQSNLIAKIVKQAALGWSEGFTTLVPEKLGYGDEPIDTAEGIARNLGHLAGFVGYIPGGKYIKFLRMLRGASVPMLAATKAQKIVSAKFKPMIQEIGPVARKFAEGTIVSDLASGAFHLGVASATSSWMHGIDDMMKSGLWGAGFGAAFRGIGNLPGFGKKLGVNQLDMTTGSPKMKTLSSGQKADLSLRTLAGSLFMGLPSTLQGATTEEQVYSYILGSFFGFKEVPYQTRTGREWIIKSLKDKTGPFPEEHPDWEGLTPPMRDIISKDFKDFYGPEESAMITYDIMSGRGINMEDIEQLAKLHDQDVNVDPVTGEIFEGIGKEGVEKYREHLKETGAYEDMNDLDMHIANVEDLASKGKPMENYVDKNFDEYFKKTSPDNLEMDKIRVSADIFSKWKETLQKGSDGFSRPSPVAEEKMYKYIAEEYGITLNEKQRGWWRSFAEQQRRKKLVQQITMVDGKPDFLDGKTNAVGNDKEIYFEPPLIQEMFEFEKRAMGKKLDVPFYTYFDHFIFKGKEYDITRVNQQLTNDIFHRMRNQEAFNDMDNAQLREHAKAEANSTVRKGFQAVMDFANSKHYYYLGGKGDAKRMYFVQYHPKMYTDTKNLKLYKSIIREAMHRRHLLTKALGGTSKNKGMSKTAFDRAWKKDLRYFKQHLNAGENAESIFTKSFISNNMYDVTFNGFPINSDSMREFKSSFNTGLDKVYSDGYINDAKGYNKRSQIWFNTGLKANPAFVFGRLKDTANGFRLGIFSEKDKSDGSIKGIPASAQAESTDGGIIGRADVIDALNLDKGLATEGGAHKSFIVAPDALDGALLGKYMIHEASPELSKWMKDNSVHLLAPVSAIKQMGGRSPGLIFQDGDGGPMKFKGPLYNIDVDTVRTIMSEITSDKSILPQRMPKQMSTNLSMYGYSPIDGKTIQDMYSTLSGKAMRGTDRGNELLTKYAETRDKVMEEEVLQNLEDVPIPELMKMLRNPEFSGFSSKVFKRLMRVQDDMIQALAEEGEISRDTAEMERKVNREFTSVVERIIKLYPEGTAGGYLHKFSRDYRMTVLRNYIVNSLTRPKMENSSSARMRPLDPGFLVKDAKGEYVHKMGELEKDDTIFFLDEGFKDMRMNDPLIIKGRNKLGEVWEDYNSGKYDNNLDAIKDILNAAVVRVPMDSLSGANILDFAGFTGVRGYGTLLHPRTMRALGGADLDGDKAFIFFGGENGMHKDWKDMYARQRDEFVKNGKELHNKDAYLDGDPKKGTLRQQFVVDSKAIREESVTPFAYYSPYWRYFMSRGASEGRDILGVAITNKSAISGAYNAIRGHTGPQTHFPVLLTDFYGNEVKGKDGKPMTGTGWLDKGTYSIPYVVEKSVGVDTPKKILLRKRIVFKIKKGEKDLERFRQLARTTVALGSDPMDEAGLLPSKVFTRKLLDTLFDYEIRDQRGRKSKTNEYETELLRSGKFYNHLLNKGLHRIFGRMNSLVYSKNFQENRRWSYADIRAGVESLYFLPESSRNSLMPLLAKDLAKINWSDNIFRRADFHKLVTLYDQHRELAEREDWLKDILQRKTLGTPMNALIKTVFKTGMWNREGMNRLVSSEEEFLKLIYTSYGKDEKGDPKYNVGATPRALEPIRSGDPDYRRAFLEHLVLKAEDFIVNDLSDMVTLQRVSQIVSDSSMMPSRIGEIHAMAEHIKNDSYMKARQRKANDGSIKEEAWSEFKDSDSVMDKGSSKADQYAVDKRIRDYKVGMTGSEKELFDTFLIGTYQRGNLSKVQELRNKRYTPEERRKYYWNDMDALELLEKKSSDTSLIRVGLSSDAVSDINVKRFFDAYDKLYKRGFEKVSDGDVELIREQFMGKEKITSLKDENGKPVEGEIIEASDLNEGDRKYLDEIGPFRGLTKGKVTDPELREIYYDIVRHLDNMHNADARQVNMLFRGITGKDMNTANKYDLKVFRNWLNEINTPSYWRRMWDYMLGKKGAAEIKRIYYMKFPLSIDRDLQREPGFRQLIDSVGPYKDRLGNTIMGKILTPMSPMAEMQQFSAKSIEQSLARVDEEKDKLRGELAPFVASLPEGDILHDIAITIRERGIKNSLRKDKTDPLLDSHEMQYESNYVENRDAYRNLRNKTYKVIVDGKVSLMRGEEVIRKLNAIYTAQNEVVHTWLAGDIEYVKERWLDMTEDSSGNLSWKGLDKLRGEWMKYLSETMRKGEKLPIEVLGIDGIRQISKRILISMTPEPLRTRKTLLDANKNVEIRPYDVTNRLPFEHYFPHIAMDRKVADQSLEKYMGEIRNNADLTEDEKKLALGRLMTNHRQLTGDYLAKDEMGENFDAMQEILNNVALNKQDKAKNILSGDLKKVGNQFSRTAHLGGWSRDPEAYDAYMKNIIDTFYRQAMQVANRTVIHEFGNRFYNKTGDAKLTNAWRNFFKLYAQSAMGYPAHIPKEVMENPLMKIKMTPYKWLSDTNTKKRVDYIRKRLGVGRKILKGWGLDEATIDELSGIEYKQLDAWSALEAKWELASLLAHPKSSIANLYGGTVHTNVNTGFTHWKNARNFEYLKTHVNPEWNSMGDVQKWLQTLGVTEEFLLYEAGLNPKIKSKRLESFAKDIGKKIRKDPDMKNSTLLEMKRKYKLTDTMWQWAASFMRIPERTLRRDAFMAHYLQAREQFGNAIRDYDHPFLIEMAKRGVKATQFLYSAPHRPMWSNSALGRVFSRFQLWSWNSVRFRNDTIRNAKVYGLQPGTQEHDRFVRLAQADAFMLGLSNLFLYSLFENALPAPWNWFQDTTDWLFGDDRDRERAFYGSPFGPLQVITPPAFRLLPPMFKAMMNGDWSRLSDYYLWTMLPFGRMIRDVWGPGNIIENPYYAVTKVTGIPLIQMGEALKGEPAYDPQGY